MKIELKWVTIRELIEKYVDHDDKGAFGYGGNLNIRPAYQRNLVYTDELQQAVIRTLLKGLPVGIMYWVKCVDGKYELMDGQQRTCSICRYCNGEFSVDGHYLHTLTNQEREEFLDRQLMIQVCEGTDREKLDWFMIINTAGKKLNDQEIRNAIYTGPWLADAKKYFSKVGGPAYNMGNKYVTGNVNEQEYLETALRWIGNDAPVAEYMALHQNDQNANALWLYFQNVINWVEATFPVWRKEMRTVNWGALYNTYGKDTVDVKAIEEQVSKLMMDDNVTKKSGIYPYIFTRNESALSIRAFTDSMKSTVYEKQKGVCVMCGTNTPLSDMEADHIKPWCEGGTTTIDNCQMLCKGCNRKKGKK